MPASVGVPTARPVRARRTVLAVPGSNVRMLAKSKSLAVDEVFCDLEDSVAPAVKAEARANVVAALREGGWQAPTVALRVNGWGSAWTYVDVAEVVGAAGSAIDTIVLPKASDAGHVRALDLLLSQVEQGSGLPVGGIGLEIQVEDAGGLLRVGELAAASARAEALVLGPADLMASLGVRSMSVGEQPPGYTPGDAYHHPLLAILVAARAHGLQAIDGPYLRVRDVDGFRHQARRTAALGYDGKWVLHPDQVAPGNEVFSPDQRSYNRAEAVLDALDHHTSANGGHRGAAMLGDEMIDEASRAMALVVAQRGRAAGLTRTSGPAVGSPPAPAGSVTAE